MRHLHEFLSSELGWYKRWHEDVHSSSVAWGIFLLFALFATSTVLNVISATFPYVDNATQVSLAVQSNRGVGVGNPRGLSDSDTIERLRVVQDGVLAKANEHALSAAGEKSARLDALKAALINRMAVMSDIVLTDPKAVRRFLFDEGALESIPESARSIVEKPFTHTGTYRIAVVSDSFFDELEESHEEYFLEVSDTERYRLALTEEEAYSVEAETHVTVTGMMLGNGVVVPTELTPDEDHEGRVLGASTVKKLAVVAFNFTNNTAQPISTDELRKRIFSNPTSVSAHIRENSYGQWDIQGRDRIDGDVYGWVTIDANANGTCDYNRWSALANQALTAQGVSMSGYTNIQYVFPNGSTGCSWAGLAYMPGSSSFVIAEYFGSGGVSAHELGHNYGFHHSGKYSCTVANSTTGACSFSEYGDGYDPMGGARMVHYNNFHKSKYWYQSSEIVTVTKTGTYALEATTDTASHGAQVLRIKRPFAVGSTFFANGYYDLEYRVSEGFDTGLDVSGKNTLQVRLVEDDYLSGSRKTYLVRTVPIGSPLVDTEGGLSIALLSATGSVATVEVTMTPVPCVENNPTVSMVPSSQWGNAGASLAYTVTVKNNDTETCSAATYDITPTLPTGFTQVVSPSTVTLAPGAQQSIGVTVTSPITAVPATYVITERVTNTSSPSFTGMTAANFNISAPDLTPPLITIMAPQDGAILSTRRVPISISGSDANGMASLEIQVDGKVVKSCVLTNVCSYTWNTGKASAGTHTIKAVAVDNSSQRNRSETQITVTK